MYELMEKGYLVAYSDMSKAELAEVLGVLSGNVIALGALMLSIMFAYGVTAYIAGNRTSVGQAVAITVAYSGLMLISLIFFFRLHSESAYLTSMLYGGAPAAYLLGQLNTLLLGAIWIGSIFYMYQRRTGDDV
jgi:hypothetical protein